ncbi:MAG: hypothetical protein IJ532_05885 [Alphaproteobacteria bacterium]|nr:hypothetical protein [Alphaproteobacteria bacterium]
MNDLLYFFICVLFGFAGMYIGYKPQSDKYAQTLKFSYLMLPLPYIYVFYAVCAIFAFFRLNNNDFIEDLTFWRVIVPLISAPIIYGACTVLSERRALLITIVCVALTVWLQPVGEGNSYPALPIWLLQIIILILAFVYCWGAMLNNFLPHTLLIPQITLLLGLAGMAFLGAAPLYIALCAGALLGALGGYLSINFYDVKIEIDNAAAITLSYMVCSLVLMNIGEMGLPSCAILTCVFWVELLTALWRYFFISRSGSLYESTNYYIAAQRLTVKELVVSISKVSAVMMFLAWFQLYSVNNYSLVIVAFCVALWLNGSMGSMSGGKQTLREINQDVMENIKQGIQETKDALSQRRKDK